MKTKERRKRKGFPLSENQKAALNACLIETHLTTDELAHKIGITYHQLANPLSSSGNCSTDSYRKIERFLAKQEGK